jgi:deazaflavin-dependent oxidoreductase (nitroreductase family)
MGHEMEGVTPVNSTPNNTRHYRRPGWVTRNLMNRLVARLTRLGVSVWGSRVLEVPGRKSGNLQHIPVNLLSHDGHDYLVSARGEGQWVRNVRANGGRFDLLVGRRRSHYVGQELADTDKVEVLRAYLKRWKAEVGAFFDGVDAGATDEAILAIAPKHPVFLLAAAGEEGAGA